MFQLTRCHHYLTILCLTEFLVYPITSMSITEIGRLKTVGMQVRDLAVHKEMPRASVLVPLVVREEKLHVLLTQRPLHLKSHPGEVCFPGGRQDPEDEGNDVETALREAHEEVGLERSCIQPLCRLVTIESRGGLCVTPVVALLEPPDIVDQLQVSKDEVAAAFTVPLDYFLEQNGNLVEKYDVPWSGGTFTLRTYNYSEDDDTTYKVWGLTAHIIHQVARIAIEESNEGTIVDDSSATTDESTETVLEGSLWLWNDKYWSENYYVLGDSMLHQYSSKEQADRKSSSATKKNRLPLPGAQATKVDTEEAHRFGFEICVLGCVLGGRIKLRLAAASEEVRDKWMAALTF